MNPIQPVLLPAGFSDQDMGLFRRNDVRFILCHSFMPSQGNSSGTARRVVHHTRISLLAFLLN